MKQPVKGSGTKAPGASAPRTKVKRKTREELNNEARERKRQKKHRGHAAGSRAQPAADSHQSGQGKKHDPRIGSKKPIALVVGEEAPRSVKPAKPIPPVASDDARLTPEQELALLENDDRLDALLERLDNGETLSAADQKWVDNTLDRINALMDILGIEMDDDEDEGEEQQEDMMQLLKRNGPKDAF